MIPWYIFPPDVDHDSATAHHDTAGWDLTSKPATHPSNGARCQVFEIPDGTSDQNGCSLQVTDIHGKARYKKPLHGVLYLHGLADGAGLLVDILPEVSGSSNVPNPIPAGTVRFIGHAWVDDSGPIYPLGDSMLYALGHWHRGGEKKDIVTENVDFIAGYKHSYVRWLGSVDWQNDQDIDPDWPQYEQNAAELIDFLFERGLRSKITVTGGGGKIRLAAQKLHNVLAGRQHKVLLSESVNEQNASASDAIFVARFMQDLGIPVATGRGNVGVQGIIDEGNIAGSLVDCLHTERGLGDPHEAGGSQSRLVRQCWDFKEFPRPSENGEPPGPTSSVSQLDDPLKLALFRFASIVCGAGAFCFHQGSGVYGVDYQSNYGFRFARFKDVPNIDRLMKALRNADKPLAKGVENWQKFNGGYGGPLVLSVQSGAVNKVYGSRSGPNFAQAVIGTDGPIVMKAVQPCHVLANNPETGEPFLEADLNQDDQLPLSGLWGYALTGQTR